MYKSLQTNGKLFLFFIFCLFHSFILFFFCSSILVLFICRYSCWLVVIRLLVVCWLFVVVVIWFIISNVYFWTQNKFVISKWILFTIIIYQCFLNVFFLCLFRGMPTIIHTVVQYFFFLLSIVKMVQLTWVFFCLYDKSFHGLLRFTRKIPLKNHYALDFNCNRITDNTARLFHLLYI